MPEATTLPRPDVTDMISVHKVFRAALSDAPRLVGSVSTGNPADAEVVASYYANILAFLEAHHGGEDVLLWPKLVARAPAQADLINRIAGQHHGVEIALQAAEQALADWTPQPDADRGAALAAALAALNAELCAHLDEEEASILPIAAEHMTIEEWGEFPGHAMAHFTGDKIWLVLGLVYNAMTPTQQEMMLTHMPPPVLEFWQNIGQAQYSAFMASLPA